MINNQLSVLVTGASSGIGLAITQYLASNGMRVFAGARKQEALEYQLMKILPASYVDKLALKKVQKVVKLSTANADHSK